MSKDSLQSSHALLRDLRQLVFIGGDVVDNNLQVALLPLPGLDFSLTCLPRVRLKNSKWAHSPKLIGFQMKTQNFYQEVFRWA